MAATNGTILGQYNGVSLAAAFSNPSSLDLLQIVDNNGGKILANVNSAGTVTLNPTTATTGTILGQFESGGSSTLASIFASAFNYPLGNPNNLDIFQVYSQIKAPASAGSGGQVLIGRLSYLGVYSTT
jgi:hypothetical protein